MNSPKCVLTSLDSTHFPMIFQKWMARIQSHKFHLHSDAGDTEVLTPPLSHEERKDSRLLQRRILSGCQHLWARFLQKRVSVSVKWFKGTTWVSWASNESRSSLPVHVPGFLTQSAREACPCSSTTCHDIITLHYSAFLYLFLFA